MDLNEKSLPALSSPGEVITFYSYKGGAGRTMALANIAQRLASAPHPAQPILMIDWDLEAPSLHHYFDCKLDGPGVLELFQSCQDTLSRQRGAPPRDPEGLARAVLDQLPWRNYICRADPGNALYLMRAGCQDDSYGERLAGLRWAELFHQCPALFRCFAQELSRHFRYVLIDAHAGRNDTTGICTALLPQKLVLVFTPERGSIDGVLGAAARAADYRRSNEDDHRPLLMFPLPSRIDVADGRRRAQWRRGDARLGVEGYQPRFERLFAEQYGVPQLSLESYFDEVLLQQARLPSCDSALAVRDEQGGDRFSLTRSVDTLLNWLVGPYFPWQSRRELELLRAIHEQRAAGHNGPGREAPADAPLPPGEAAGLHELHQGSSAELYQQAVRPVHGSGAGRHGLHVVADADLIPLDGTRNGPR